MTSRRTASSACDEESNSDVLLLSHFEDESGSEHGKPIEYDKHVDAMQLEDPRSAHFAEQCRSEYDSDQAMDAASRSPLAPESPRMSEADVLEDDAMDVDDNQCSGPSAMGPAGTPLDNRGLPLACYREIEESFKPFFVQPKSYIKYCKWSDEVDHDDDRVDYEIDSDDEEWLTEYHVASSRNAALIQAFKRSKEAKVRRPNKSDDIIETTDSPIQHGDFAVDFSIISEDDFEYVMDSFEKQAFVISRTLTVSDEADDELQGCNVCGDGTSDDLNQILFCDGCNVPIHQHCYGVDLIPEGEWFCQRCELLGHRSENTVRCLFCGKKRGAMKLSSRNEWIHVQCALWLPETGFEDVDCTGPVLYHSELPDSRWKDVCYICKKRRGVPIACHKPNCKNLFHVTCGQDDFLAIYIEEENGDLSYHAWCAKHTPKWHREDREQCLKDNKRPKPPKRRKNARKCEDSSDDEINPSNYKYLYNPDAIKKAESPRKERRLSTFSLAGLDVGVDDDDGSDFEDNGIRRSKRPKHPKQFDEPEPQQRQYIVGNRVVDEDVIKIAGGLSYQEAIRGLYSEAQGTVMVGEAVKAVKSRKKLDTEVIKSIYTYWFDKRERRRGVPLLKKFAVRGKPPPKFADLTHKRMEHAFNRLWNFRKHLERLRLILELLRRRERLRRELFKTTIKAFENNFMPTVADMRFILDIMKENDPHGLFSSPMSTEDFGDYYDTIPHPMDLDTVENKLNHCQYQSEEEFLADLRLIPRNAMVYHAEGSIHYTEAMQFQQVLEQVLSGNYVLPADFSEEVEPAAEQNTATNVIIKETADFSAPIVHLQHTDEMDVVIEIADEFESHPSLSTPAPALPIEIQPQPLVTPVLEAGNDAQRSNDEHEYGSNSDNNDDAHSSDDDAGVENTGGIVAHAEFAYSSSSEEDDPPKYREKLPLDEPGSRARSETSRKVYGVPRRTKNPKPTLDRQDLNDCFSLRDGLAATRLRARSPAASPAHPRKQVNSPALKKRAPASPHPRPLPATPSTAMVLRSSPAKPISSPVSTPTKKATKKVRKEGTPQKHAPTPANVNIRKSPRVGKR